MVDGRAGEDADCPTRSPGEAGEGRMFDWRHLTIPPPPALLDNFWWADQWCFLHDVSPGLAVIFCLLNIINFARCAQPTW
jgi:hypothetical protein